MLGTSSVAVDKNNLYTQVRTTGARILQPRQQHTPYNFNSTVKMSANSRVHQSRLHDVVVVKPSLVSRYAGFPQHALPT